MPKSKKKTFLLFETLIALSLVTILLSLLFSFMVQSLRVEKKMQQTRSSILERQNLQIRLQDIFTSLSPSQEDDAFYTQVFPDEKKESLAALFDNGVDPDPSFSGLLVGRIYLDEQNNLSFVYGPKEKTPSHKQRKETLLSNVSDISFEFLTEPREQDKKLLGTINSIWLKHWAKEKKEIPSIVRLTLKQENRNVPFAFRLPQSFPIPTYRSLE